ncbi:uncharacterized protein LOC127005300 [Eriocheir sinensis]|uniref:uncharacterized protein LOC127005300 n=1 Tax=Eriocheir sinensis TaxID=95602 RepID=UPI0021C5C25D|nr:uncharacterized protein LOC127005300 [Eriocheir sinensis]
MVVIGVVGGILAIKVLKSEGALIPAHNTSDSSFDTTSSSSSKDNAVDRRNAGLLNSNHVEEAEEEKEERDPEDDQQETLEEKEAIVTNLINKLVYALKRVSPEKMEAVDRDTRANVIKRYRRETALTERKTVLSSEGLNIRVRHPKNKLHHRKFDQLFQTLIRKGEKGEEKEKVIVKKIDSYPDGSREKLHHGNFNNIVPMLTGREKEKEIMKGITKTDNSESKTDAETLDNELVSFYRHKNTNHANRNDSLVNAAKNATELVKMTKLSNLDLHLPVLMAFFFLLFLASFTLLYSCYVCMCYLRRKKEREKERPFTIL